MALELAEITAGLPLAASFAFAGGISTLREGKKRSALNEALHELRRPLQAMVLAVPTGEQPWSDSLQIAAAALQRLDREINGGAHPGTAEAVPLRPLVNSAAARGRMRAERENRSLRLHWSGADVSVLGDEFELSQALDNLISNGLEHGVGKILVEVRSAPGQVRLIVHDQGRASRSPLPTWRRFFARVGGRSRHGHGLRIVRRTAARCGGSFRLACGEKGTTATLQLPAFDQEPA